MTELEPGQPSATPGMPLDMIGIIQTPTGQMLTAEDGTEFHRHKVRAEDHRVRSGEVVETVIAHLKLNRLFYLHTRVEFAPIWRCPN